MYQTHTFFLNQGKFKKSNLSYIIHIFKELENKTNLNLFKLILRTKQVHISYQTSSYYLPKRKKHLPIS